MSGRNRTVKTLSYKVNKLLSEVERKTFDVAATQAVGAATAGIIQLSSIPQGDDFNQRDGRKVTFVSSQMRYTFQGTTNNTGYRVMVLVDKQSNGITPVPADILTAPTDIRSPMTIEFKERFRVLHDNYCGFGKGDYDFVALDNGLKPCSYWRKIPDDLAQAEFGGIGAIPTTSSIVMLFLATDPGSLKYYHRLRFTDN
jgi:hypothetical protein